MEPKAEFGNRLDIPTNLNSGICKFFAGIESFAESATIVQMLFSIELLIRNYEFHKNWHVHFDLKIIIGLAG